MKIILNMIMKRSLNYFSADNSDFQTNKSATVKASLLVLDMVKVFFCR